MRQLIGGGNSRNFLAVTSEENDKKSRIIKVWTRFPLFGIRLGVVFEPKEHAGKILVPKWEYRKTDNPHWRAHELIWQMVDSIYAAYRQTFHVLTQYGLDLKSGEKSAMLAASDAACELNLTVLGLEPGRSVMEMRSATRSAYLRFGKAMGVVPRKTVKKEGIALMTAVQVGADTRGRVNPSMAMAKSRAAAHRAMARLHDEIMYIDPRIEARQKVLVNMIQLAELRLRSLNDLLTKLLERDGLLPLTLNLRRRQVVATQLQYYAEDLGAIDFNPYRHACAKTAQDLYNAAVFLKASRYINATNLRIIRRLLVNCHSAIAIKAQQIEIERLIFRLTKIVTGRKAIAPAFTESIRAGMNRISGELDRINEQGFRRPVCREAINQLIVAKSMLFLNSSEAVAKLKLQPDGQIHNLGNIRESLKKASAAL